MIQVEAGEEAFGSVFGINFETARRVGVAGDRALCLGPFHNGGGPAWPAFGFASLGARESLVLQVQQADMAEGLRTKAADFQIVLHNMEGRAQFVTVGLEK